MIFADRLPQPEGALDLGQPPGLLVERYGGEVPRRLEQLVKLPGVGRKTAAVVLGNAFGLATRASPSTPTSAASCGGSASPPRRTRSRSSGCLLGLVPRPAWTLFTHLLIAHGRAVCTARAPRCDGCVLLSLCPEGQSRVGGSAPARTRNARRARGDTPEP